MKRLLIICMSMLAFVNIQAQEVATNDDDAKIYRLVMMISHNHGDTYGFTLPISDCPFADMTQQKTTSLVISLISVMATDDVTDVTFCATMYNTSIGHTSSDEWREIKLEKNKLGQWELNRGDDIELIEQEWLSENETHSFEFYIKAKCAGENVLYNNGGQNYKWTFTTGEGSGDTWRIKFTKEQKASIRMGIDPFIGPMEYIFTDETERTNNEQLGLTSSIAINNFCVPFIRNDNVDIKSVSLLYKVYEKGLNADWKYLNANQHLEEMIFNKKTLRYENYMCYDLLSPIECKVTEGLTPGKEYVLEIMFQVVDTENNCYTFLQDEECFRFHFSFMEKIVYRPFIEEGKVWKVGYFPGDINTAKKLDYYYFDGDSIIDGRQCKKMMCRHEANEPWGDPVPWTEYVGSICEEGDCVYCVFPNEQYFKLLYDFATRVIGEKINIYDPFADNKTGSCILERKFYEANEYYKGYTTAVALSQELWNLEDEEHNVPLGYDHEHLCYWREGIGTGIPLNNVYHRGWCGYYYMAMSCIVGDEVLYYNPDLIDGATSPDEAEVKKQWIDFTHIQKPKPKAPRKGEKTETNDYYETLTGEYSTKELFVNFKTLAGSYSITITNDADQEVYHKEVQTSNIVALNTDLSTYAKGSYTLTVENAEEAYTATFILGDKTAVRDIPAQHILNSKSSNRTWYDLSGRRLMMPHAKGIYIRDGRKIVVK